MLPKLPSPLLLEWSGDYDTLVDLASETASLAESSLSSSWHAQHGVAARAHYYGLGVAEDSCAAKKYRRIGSEECHIAMVTTLQGHLRRYIYKKTQRT